MNDDSRNRSTTIIEGENIITAAVIERPQFCAGKELGTVIYGNIGAANRLDFTVIGPAVNLVSRIEAVAKSRDLPLIVSDDFARLYGGALQSLGLHTLRGLDQQHKLFAAAGPSDERVKPPGNAAPAHS